LYYTQAIDWVDYTIQAISLELYNSLGAFIQLIVVNCIILARAESYASKYPPLKSVISAFGAALVSPLTYFKSVP